MKKIVALVLVVMMALSMFCVASAEERAYAATGAVDAEMNAVEFDLSQYALVMYIDDEAGVCAFGTEEEAQQGTFEYVTDEESGLTYIVLTLEDGTQAEMIYDAEQDIFLLYIEEADVMLLFENATAAVEAA